MPESNQRPKVTVEDLLHLKRAERPATEFWTKFEQELRQKQLTALMEKRPWWQELPQFLVRRAYVPVGATAILAFTLVSVKYYAPNSVAQVESVPTGAPVAVDRDVAVKSSVAVSSPLVNRSETVAALPADQTIAATAAVSAETTTDVVELMPMLVAPREAEKPSARLLANNLAKLEQPDADFMQAALANRLGSPAREQVAAPAAEELASVPAASARRSRLFARYEGRQVSPEPTLPEAVRQKLVRRLGDPDPDRSTRLAREMDSFSTQLPQVVALRF